MSGVDIRNVSLRTRVTCPYNPAHVMNYSKFHSHFVKCQKQHPNDPRKPCPYNFSELIHPDKMFDHVQNCSYRVDYGNKSTEYDYSKGQIVAPLDVPFGPDVKDEPSQPKDEPFEPRGRDNLPERRYTLQSAIEDNDVDWDDQIDSISVVAERQRASGDSISGLTSTPSLDLGRGRAQALRRLGIIQPARFDPEKQPPRNSDQGFSFLREENIRPSSEAVTENVLEGTSSSPPQSKPSVDDERITFLEKLQDEAAQKHNEEMKSKGRGRGRIWVRRF